MADQNHFPRMERACLIEVPAPRNGRPGYRWTQGRVIHYSENRVSMPVQFSEAKSMLAQAKDAE